MNTIHFLIDLFGSIALFIITCGLLIFIFGFILVLFDELTRKLIKKNKSTSK